MCYHCTVHKRLHDMAKSKSSCVVAMWKHTTVHFCVAYSCILAR